MVNVHSSLLRMLKNYLNTTRAKFGKLLYEPNEKIDFSQADTYQIIQVRQMNGLNFLSAFSEQFSLFLSYHFANTINDHIAQLK